MSGFDSLTHRNYFQPMPPRKTILRLLILIATISFIHAAFAENPLPSVERLKTSSVLRHLKPNPMPQPPRTPAEQTIAQMYLPEGFRTELIAAEPDLHQPITFAWDDRGRLWVAEANSYPTKRPDGKGLDNIVIFEDRDGDGIFETKKVFAQGLNLVSAIEVGYGGIWVGAAPQLLFIPDRNHDDVPDGPPEVLLDGFGFQDTHECMNSFLWGPDGWLYGNQGVFNLAHIGKPGAPDKDRTELRAGVWRYHPVRHEFEVFAHGGSNPWGLDYDEHGQLFMTHCRSYWGRGMTTHVIQGGHFWNQSNANHAPFIIANPPAEFPSFRNYLLASARIDHGAGGAGKAGTDAIYGGHSHVGTMIYQGDNWPDEFRGRLFTHNLGGHQINQMINNPLGSGFDTVDEGHDMSFCTDPKYVAVDLQYGPDGAVYIIDWYDQQHCHNPNTERWDRSNGRIYRMEWSATYKPVKVDLTTKTDVELVELLSHKNQWFVRHAQGLLNERAATGKTIDENARTKILAMATSDPNPLQRLQGLWTAHAIGAFTDDVANRTLADADPYVRGWTIQLALDQKSASPALLNRFAALAKTDPSPIVRLYLASAIERVPESAAWPIIQALVQHAEDRDDRNLPLILWDGLAQRMPAQLDKAFAIAAGTPIASITDYIYWYAATLEGDALNRSIAALSENDATTLHRQLAGLWLAMEPRANLAMPAAWKAIAPRLYANPDVRIARQAEQLAAVFGDDTMFPRLRQTLADATAKPDDRKHAFAVLSRALDRASLDTFIQLVDDDTFRSQSIKLLSRFDSPAIADALLAHFEAFSPADRAAALAALTSRAAYATALLDAVTANRIRRDQLTAFHVRQLTALKNAEVDKRVTAIWGRILQTPAEKLARINKLEKTFDEAPLWAYDAGAGKEHFQKLCAVCHRIGDEGARLGPELTGAGKNGIRYLLENIMDPDAVIGADFQATVIRTKSGDVVSGLLASESGSAVTLRTTAGESVIAKTEIESRETSQKSLMPEGLLESLPDREQLELLKFLTTH
jgi:putative membrane-bound dehydrogenase-like protein